LDVHDRSLSPDDVLVVAGLSGVWGLNTTDGSLLWEHTKATSWPVAGVPRVAHVGDGIVVVAGLKTIAWVRVTDGKIMGADELWFVIEQIVHHGPLLVVHGTVGGIACYRNGTRTWGVAGINRDPKAVLFTEQDAWTTDAYGRPTTRAGTLTCHQSVALVLGDSVTQIDRTQPG
jgi:hypothetical protein